MKNGGLLQCRFSLSRHLDRPRVGLSGNLHCKSPPFLTKWFDLLDLSKQKKLLDMLYIHPRGVREGIALIFSWKSVFEKHPTAEVSLDSELWVEWWLLPHFVRIYYPSEQHKRKLWLCDLGSLWWKIDRHRQSFANYVYFQEIVET